MSETTKSARSAVLTIAVDALTPELRAALADLGATVVDTASLDEPLVVKFDPIAGPDGGEITSITVREPSALQMAQWDKLDGDAAKMKAVSVCAAVPVAVVEKMRARPYLQALRRVEAFLA